MQGRQSHLLAHLCLFGYNTYTTDTRELRGEDTTMAEQFAYKIPLVFEPQPEGGYTVTCPILPELITEGDTIAEALANVEDALIAIIETYEDLNALDLRTPFWIEMAVQRSQAPCSGVAGGQATTAPGHPGRTT